MSGPQDVFILTFDFYVKGNSLGLDSYEAQQALKDGFNEKSAQQAAGLTLSVLGFVPTPVAPGADVLNFMLSASIVSSSIAANKPITLSDILKITGSFSSLMGDALLGFAAGAAVVGAEPIAIGLAGVGAYLKITGITRELKYE